jgi:hypothetical protein
VGTASLCRRWHFLRSSSWSLARTARFCLVLLACLGQLWMPAQHRHAPGIAMHTMVSGAAAEGSGPTLVGIGAGQKGVPCALHSTHASTEHGNAPPPCTNGDCPCCAFCPCCALMDAAMGILPQELARADYATLTSTFAAAPASLGPVTRLAARPGQPRAPPVLI